jgi:hypothetical protein
VIAEHSPFQPAILEAAVCKAVRAAEANSHIEVVQKHLAPVKQYKPEDCDLIEAVSGITVVYGKRELLPRSLAALVTVGPGIGRVVVAVRVAQL